MTDVPCPEYGCFFLYKNRLLYSIEKTWWNSIIGFEIGWVFLFRWFIRIWNNEQGFDMKKFEKLMKINEFTNKKNLWTCSLQLTENCLRESNKLKSNANMFYKGRKNVAHLKWIWFNFKSNHDWVVLKSRIIIWLIWKLVLIRRVLQDK